MDKPKRIAGELWRDRRTAIKETHICVFLGSFRVARRTLKIAIGANETGITQLLAYHISVGSREDRWTAMLESVADNCRSELIPSPFRSSGSRRLLFVTQSNGEIWKAIGNVFGSGHAIQACRTERERRVLTLSPDARRKGIKRTLTKIWKQDEGLAIRGMEALAAELRSESAEASEELESGLTYLFTINRLGLPSELHRFLGTTGLISKFEKNLRAKIRSRTRGRQNSRVSVDALTAVCRETLLAVEQFDIDLVPLVAALKASTIANDVVPTPTGRPFLDDVASDEKTLTSLDANVRIRVNSTAAASDEPTLAMCVSWIKSVTTQMRSLLNGNHPEESGERANQLRPKSVGDSRVEGKAIILRSDRVYSEIWSGVGFARQMDRGDLSERPRTPDALDAKLKRVGPKHGGNGHGFPYSDQKPSNNGLSLSSPGRWSKETLRLLPIRSVRGVVQHAGRLAKRIRPVVHRMRHPMPERSIGGGGNRDIATLADRLFVIPGLAAPRCVVFSGLDRGVGCSRVASSVAETLASRVSGSVCIVDANCRDPFLHNHFQLDNSAGLIEAATSPESVLSFAQRPFEGNLWVLPTHVDTTNPAGFPSTDHMRALVNELIAEFDYVLIDGPPLATTIDSALLARMSDGLVLVLEADKTLRERARSVKSDLELAEVPVIAAVLNKRSFPIPDLLYRRFLGNA